MKLYGHFDWGFVALCLCAVFAGFSMPAARVFLLVAIVGAIVRRAKLRFPPAAWLWCAIFALAIVTTACGVNPGKGLSKLSKLLWYIGIPAAATLVTTRERLATITRCVVGGLTALAVKVLLCNIIGALAIVERFAGTRMERNFWLSNELIQQGSLIDGERLMIGIVILAALIFEGIKSRDFRVSVENYSFKLTSRGIAWGALGVMIAAEIVALKRGSWLATIAAVALMWFANGRRKVRGIYLIGAGIAFAALACVAPIRERVLDLREELTLEKSGRLAMWTQIAPPLLREHPQGIGFRSLTNEMMREYLPDVENDRDHLHSNPVDIAVSLGWFGLALWCVWCAVMLRTSWITARPLFWAIFAILLNGLAEYNFADGEIIILLGLLAGASAGSFPRAAEKSAEK